MRTESVDTARALLLTWIACDEKKSYEAIRRNCVYLDKSYCLDMGDNAMWKLFCPLLRTGVIDYVGKDCYALTEPVAIQRDGFYLYTGLPQYSSNATKFTGIFRTQNIEDVGEMRILPFDGTSVLRHMPSVDKLVDSFNKSVADLSMAEYYHWKGKKGLTKRLNDGAVRYFCIPEKMYQREIPGREINPDAFSIAYNWSRSINNEASGCYSSLRKTLTMQTFGLPIMIERVLFLESMTQGMDPNYQEREIEYPSISLETAKEIDRILCKTLRYE